jgi:hypothetical protein
MVLRVKIGRVQQFWPILWPILWPVIPLPWQQPLARLGQTSRCETITEFATCASNSAPIVITSGPDGNLWFTENRKTGASEPGRYAMLGR